MKKLLILQRVIAHYRIPIWNIIAEKYNLTIGYFENDFSANKDCKFSVKKFDYNKIGPFIWVRNLRQFAKQFEVVCFMPDPHVLSYVSLPFYLTHTNCLHGVSDLGVRTFILMHLSESIR